MSRYYGYVVITFTDGTTERIGANRDQIYEGQLRVFTQSDYGDRREMRHYPLANIREWHWEGE